MMMFNSFLFVFIALIVVSIVAYLIDQSASTKSSRDHKSRHRPYEDSPKRINDYKDKAYKFKEMSKNQSSKTQHKVKQDDPLKEEDDFFKKYDDLFDDYDKKYAETKYDKKK